MFQNSNLFQFVWGVEHVGDVLGGLGLRLGLQRRDLHRVVGRPVSFSSLNTV